MKKFIEKDNGLFAAFAWMITTVNSACIFYTHQELLPQVDKKLRKF